MILPSMLNNNYTKLKIICDNDISLPGPWL